MSNYKEGTEFDPDSPFNELDYEYELISPDKKGIYMEFELSWSKGCPEDSIYFPRIVKIDLEDIYNLIDKKLGRC